MSKQTADLQDLGNENVDSFHRNRRMFCIHSGELLIAPAAVEYSHTEWFRRLGWSEDAVKQFVATGLRGMIDPKGDVVFYTGDDFVVNDDIEQQLFQHLDQIVDQMGVADSAKVIGGCIIHEPGVSWSPRREYGLVQDYIYQKEG